MTDTATTTLTDWLTQQLDADEAVARAAAAGVDVWSAQDEGVCDEQGSHVGYSPTRVLATIAAHRAIVELHPRCDVHDRPGDECDACTTCGDGSLWPCDTLRALSAIYVDRDGYRKEWAL